MKRLFFVFILLLTTSATIFSLSSFTTDESDGADEIITIPPATDVRINDEVVNSGPSGMQIYVCFGAGVPCSVHLHWGSWSYSHVGSKDAAWPDVYVKW